MYIYWIPSIAAAVILIIALAFFRSRKRLVDSLNTKFNNPDNVRTYTSLVQIMMTIVSAILGLCGLIISIIVFFKQKDGLEIQRQSDITFRYEQRWQDVETDMRNQVEKGQISIERYEILYWGIQYEQWVMYNHTNLLPEIYRTWMDFRYREYERNDSMRYDSTKFIHYRDGFKLGVKSFPPAFDSFYTNVVFTGGFNHYDSTIHGQR